MAQTQPAKAGSFYSPHLLHRNPLSPAETMELLLGKLGKTKFLNSTSG